MLQLDTHYLPNDYQLIQIEYQVMKFYHLIIVMMQLDTPYPPNDYQLNQIKFQMIKFPSPDYRNVAIEYWFDLGILQTTIN